jgi:putative peptidoglycan lipid II flippase
MSAELIGVAGSANAGPPPSIVPEAESVRVARSAGMMSAAIGLSRLTGLVREVVMAREFGAGFTYDAFLLGFRIPNLGRDLFAEGALSSAFVPTFTATLRNQGEKEAEHLSNLLSTALLTVVGIVCVVAIIFTPQIVWLLAPGFAVLPGKFALAVHLTRLMIPFLLVITLSAQLAGLLNSCGSFGIPAVASVFFNLGSVGIGTALGFWLGPHLGVSPIEGMSYGIVAGGVLQLLFQIPKVRSLGFRQRLAFDWSHPGLRHIVRLMIPGIVANGAVLLNVIVNTAFASGLNDPIRGHNGPVSWLAYALRFVQLPLALFGISFASAVLPSVSRSLASNDLEQFRRTISQSLAVVLVLTIPSALTLIVLGKPIVGAIYQGGRFNAYDTQQTALALACYAGGLMAFAAARVLNPVFYALSDARIPMLVSLVSVGMNVALPLLFLNIFHAGFASLALTTALAITLECALLLELLRRRLGGIDGRFLLDRFWRIAASSIAVALATALVYRLLIGLLHPSRKAYFVELAICLPFALAGFIASFRIFRVEETEIAFEAFRSPLRKANVALRARIRW